MVKIRTWLLAVFTLFFLFGSNPAPVYSIQANSGRTVYLTLIPDYQAKTIRFDGMIGSNPQPADPPALNGFPLQIDEEWQESPTSSWNIIGAIQDGKVELKDGLYHLKLGPIELQPQEKVSFTLAYVNLDYFNIQPLPNPPDEDENNVRQLTHRFSYQADRGVRTIEQIDIPFSPVRMDVDLFLTPLVGESLTGRSNGFRLSGKVHFDSFTSLEELSRYCQDTAHRLQYGDYRMEHLLSALDYPYYSASGGLNPAFQFKPTVIALRSELIKCQYDREQPTESYVEAVFSGKAYSSSPNENLLPEALHDFARWNNNDPFAPDESFRGTPGYRIKLGKIVLAPQDTLGISIPYTRLQVDAFSPAPDHLTYLDAENDSSQIKISYTGPASFDLSLPYIPQTTLYASQFPALLRPSLLPIENQFRARSLLAGAGAAWFILILGPLLYLFSLYRSRWKWLAIPGWFLIAVSFYYGVRGPFGLLVVAILLYAAQAVSPGLTSGSRSEILRTLIKALAGLMLITISVYLDQQGSSLFLGLAGPDLSPLTPLVLMLLSIALFLLLYGRSATTKRFAASDLPVLIVLLTVLALYDAFDKSLLALLILFGGGSYITYRAAQGNAGKAPAAESQWGKDLRRRWKLAFGNRLVLLAIVILMIFAIVHDLSSTYANQMQVQLSPLFAPLVVPLLVIVSVFLTFSGIALLFILVYPFIPLTAGYLKAAAFAMALFLVFLFGIGTDDRLMASLPNILVGRVIYYLSMPMLIGVILDIQEFMRNENKRLAVEGAEKKAIDFRTASSSYFKNLQGMLGTAAGIVSLVAPTLYAFLSDQPLLVTYFSLLEKLVLLPG